MAMSSSYYASGFKDAVVASYDGVGESLSMLVACARNGNILVPEDPTIEAVHPDFPEYAHFLSFFPCVFCLSGV